MFICSFVCALLLVYTFAYVNLVCDTVSPVYMVCVYVCLDLCNKLFIPAFSSDTGHGVRVKLLQPQTTPIALWELPTMPK